MSTSKIGYRVARRGDRAPNDGMLWRTEAESRSGAGAVDRPALQEVLFCLRADLVDDIRVPSWEDLGDPITRELVCDEIWTHRASLTVAGDIVEPGHPLPSSRQDTHDRVRATCAALRTLLPRQQGKRGQLDIGRGLSKNEIVRLAHKLHLGLQLTMSQTADLLNQAGYVWSGARGEQLFNKQIVHRLLEYAAWDEDAPLTVDGERIRAGGRSHQVLQDFDAMVVYEPDRDQDYVARWREAQKIAEKYEHTAAFSFTPGTPGFGLTDLLYYVTIPLTIKTLYVADSCVFTDELERQVAYTWVEHFGIHVLEAGKPVLSTGEGRGQKHVMQQAVKNYAALRVHDSYTVIEPTRSIDHARAVASRLKDEGGYTYEEIARHLKLEAIPTRKRRGAWGKSAVMDLLSSGAAS